MWLAWFWTWPQLMPMLASEAPFTSFAARLQEKIPPDLRPKLRFVGSQEARLIWYGDVRMPRVIDQLELLRMQGGRRSLQKEIELIAREMVRLLSGDEPVLLVAGRSDYVRFLSEAPATLAKENNPFPRTYLWLQTDIGAKKTQYVVFGNQPPPWPETPLNPPSDKLRQAPATTRPATSGPS